MATVRTPDDINIEDSIRSAILWNPRLDSFRINVSAGSGIVTLTGTVDSYAQKVYAGNVAMNIKGVKDVINEISVTPGTAIDDEAIRLDLIDAMERSRALNWTNINVDVANGTVTLTGSVNDYIALSTAERLAFYTKGVVDVNNQLKVKE
jgi:osmotically-inducible protein OsmY